MDISYIANTTIFRELHVTMRQLAKSYYVTLPPGFEVGHMSKGGEGNGHC